MDWGAREAKSDSAYRGRVDVADPQGGAWATAGRLVVEVGLAAAAALVADYEAVGVDSKAVVQ